MEIIAGISALTNGLNIAKSLRGLEKSYDAATYRAQIADLVDALTDAKLAMSEAKETLAENAVEIKRLKEAFEIKSDLVKGRGDYQFFADEMGNPVGYPICPKCESIDGRIVQIKQHKVIDSGRCPVCISEYLPVTCYLPKESGGPETAEDLQKIKRDQESARTNAILKGAGKSLI